MEPQELRRLCHGLLLGEGVSIANFRSTATYDEFATANPSIWHSRSGIVRIFHHRTTQADLDRLALDMEIAGAVEALAVTPHGADDAPDSSPFVNVISADELAGRITSSPLVEWNEETPRLATSRVELALKLSEMTALLDPVGIQWLPALALNELPPSIAGVDVTPEDLLEQKLFRLMTASFFFDGIRYGEARRGKRYPDSVLFMPNDPSKGVLVDCKAASSGYRMISDHLLRFVGYWEELSSELSEQGVTLTHLAIVSSYFPGEEGDRHPFHGRSLEIEERTGLTLSYLTASDLAWTAAQVEAADMQPATRRSVDWGAILDAGLVTGDVLSTAFEGVH